ncbi:MAG: asparagine synthase-related protein [Gaiellaceae bacterium]
MSGHHLVGFAHGAPADAAVRLRAAMGRLGVAGAALHESPWLTLAFGPAASCAVVDGETTFAVVAGVLFPDEPLAGSLSRFGDEAPRHLRFEGALLASDLRRRSISVARDHLGYGSLYWTEAEGTVAFATELRLLLAVLSRRPAPDATAIALWLGLDASRSDLSFYEGVRQVPAGHRLVVAAEGAGVESYWRPTYVQPETWTLADAAEELRPAVVRAVERRLPRGAGVGVLMSGGVDSSAVAGFAHALRPDVVAYSEVFPSTPQVDESPWIDDVVHFLGIESVRAAVEPQGVLEDLTSFIRSWSLPPDSSNYWAHPLLVRAAEDGRTTILTGEGGDEVFAVRDGLIADRLHRGRVLSAYKLTCALPQMFLYPPPRRVASAFWQLGVQSAFPRLARDSSAGPAWLAPSTRRALREAADPDGWRRFDAPRWWADTAYNFTARIPAVGVPALQRRLGEAAGIRMCSPLLDVDLLEKSLRCPPELGFNGVFSKPLLRAVAAGSMPDSVRLRRGKTWFVRMTVDGLGGADFGAIARLLGDPAAEVNAYLDREVILRDLLGERPPGYGAAAAEWSFLLYRALALECWLRQERDPGFLDRLQEREQPAPRAFAIHRA